MDYGATRFTVDAGASIYALHEQRTICGMWMSAERQRARAAGALAHGDIRDVTGQIPFGRPRRKPAPA
jgi:hypothetical protein